MSDLRRQWNESCLAAGIPSLSTETCAIVFAVVYLSDNDENIVMNNKIQADIKYIQKRFHFYGGVTPDCYFACLVKEFITDIHAVLTETNEFPQYARDLFKEYYNIELRKPCISK